MQKSGKEIIQEMRAGFTARKKSFSPLTWNLMLAALVLGIAVVWSSMYVLHKNCRPDSQYYRFGANLLEVPAYASLPTQVRHIDADNFIH